MKTRRTYKHTQKFLQKKAEREQRNAILLAQRRAKRQEELALFFSGITPLMIIQEWLNVRYDISEMEYTFGSNDFVKQRILEVVRMYLDDIYSKEQSPTIQGLEDFLLNFALNEFCQKLGINDYIYDSLKSINARNELIEKVWDFVFYNTPLDENLKNSLESTNEELVEAASQAYKNFNSKDIRKGSKDVRNQKRRDLVKLILEHFEDLITNKLSIRKLAEQNSLNRDTLRKYYNKVKSILQLGQTIDDQTFNEKKRGRKNDPNPLITKEMLTKLEEDLQDIPGRCGLQFASWTGEAIQVYFKTFYNLDISMNYLYKFLHSHNIISKFASRKNPKADPEEVASFKRNVYNKFKQAILNNETIVFLDETQVQQGSHARGYAKKGEKAYYSYNTENLHSEYTILTVIGFDFVMIFKHKGSMTAEDYGKYLLELHKKYPEKHFVIFRDNARIHTAKELGEFFEIHGLLKSMRFEALPKYSPELNPVELFNNEFKGFLKKYSAERIIDVSKKADIFIELFQDSNKDSTSNGRRKARQYMKGEKCEFIYKDYLRAMSDVRLTKLKERRNNIIKKSA